MVETLDIDELLIQLASFTNDPVGFVYWAFDWGQGELEGQDGPEDWQIEILQQLGAGLISLEGAIQLARTSGHGIGKSALVSWIILWAISTFEDTKGVVTANTENQLKTKTWAELAKWYRLFVAKSLFKMTATALFSADPEHEKTWRIDMVPWSERNTEAFAGLHNQSRRILVVFDEASAIPDVIWETTEGALTDRNTQIIWAVFGNPTRNKGRFRECFAGGRFAHRWKSKAIDSRSVRFTDKAQIERWVKDYGEDSDFVRIRVRGVFPRIDAVSFISYESALAAVDRKVEFFDYEPRICGVDVARFGDDASVIMCRQGRSARHIPMQTFRGLDTQQLAAKIATFFLQHKCQICMVDGGGVGGGVIDRLRVLRIPVVEVDFGSRAEGTNLDDGSRYSNKRAEIWGAVRNWLETGSIPREVDGQDASTIDELIAPNYFITDKEEIRLESKRDMRSRGVASPNWADALACTFALPLFTPAVDGLGRPLDTPPVVLDDYDPFSRERMQA